MAKQRQKRRSPNKRKPFDIADYLNKYTNEQLSCMGAGTLCLWMALDPTLWGHKHFKKESDYVAAATRGARELRKIFPSKPLPDRARRRSGGYIWRAVIRRLRKTTSIKRIGGG